jgi:hypothetical protein
MYPQAESSVLMKANGCCISSSDVGSEPETGRFNFRDGYLYDLNVLTQRSDSGFFAHTTAEIIYVDPK